MSQLTREEKMNLISKGIEARRSGNRELSIKLAQQLPMAAWLAKGVKDIFGKEYLDGWDLSEAEAAYGKDWLNP